MAVTVPKSLLWKAIRAKCLDCCCQQQGEVDQCPVEQCPIWPYRYGKSIQAREKRLAYLHSKDSNTEVEIDEDDEIDNLSDEDAEESNDKTGEVETEK